MNQLELLIKRAEGVDSSSPKSPVSGFYYSDPDPSWTPESVVASWPAPASELDEVDSSSPESPVSNFYYSDPDPSWTPESVVASWPVQAPEWDEVDYPEERTPVSPAGAAGFTAVNGLGLAASIDPAAPGSRSFRMDPGGINLGARHARNLATHKQQVNSSPAKRIIPAGFRGLGVAFSPLAYMYRKDQIMNGGAQRDFYGAGSWQDRLNTGMELGAAGVDATLAASDLAAFGHMTGRGLASRIGAVMPRMLTSGAGAAALSSGAGATLRNLAAVGMSGPAVAGTVAYEAGKLYRDGLIQAMQDDESANRRLNRVEESRNRQTAALFSTDNAEEAYGASADELRALKANLRQQQEAAAKFHFANEGMENLQIGSSVMDLSEDGSIPYSNISSADPNTAGSPTSGDIYLNKLNAPQYVYRDASGAEHSVPVVDGVNPYQMQIRELQADNVESRVPFYLRPFLYVFGSGTGPTRPLTEDDLAQQQTEREAESVRSTGGPRYTQPAPHATLSEEDARSLGYLNRKAEERYYFPD